MGRAPSEMNQVGRDVKTRHISQRERAAQRYWPSPAAEPSGAGPWLGVEVLHPRWCRISSCVVIGS